MIFNKLNDLWQYICQLFHNHDWVDVEKVNVNVYKYGESRYGYPKHPDKVKWVYVQKCSKCSKIRKQIVKL